MPIYEFYCPDCHALFNFLSKTVNTEGRPVCPRCRKRKLQKEVSMFAAVRRHKGGGEGGDAMGDLPIDESKMERAIESLAGDAEGMNEEDPRQAARLMRKFSNMTGIQYGKGMEEALGRLESGEDMEAVEKEMGDALESDEEPFVMPGQKGAAKKGARRRSAAPDRDPTLYEM